jgi:hypothetical protein
MQIKITIDCTPQEAREFLGLPDVSPLHDIYLDRMKEMMEKGITPDMVGDLVKNWSSMGDAGIAIAQQLFGQLGSTLTGGLGSKKGGQS